MLFLARLLAVAVSAVPVLLGIVMLISPHKYHRLWARISGLDKLTYIDPAASAETGLQLGTRVGGLVSAVIGYFLLRVSLLALVSGEPPPTSKSPLAPTPQSGGDLYSLAVGIALLAAGLYVMARPVEVARFFFSKLPSPRIIREHAVPTFRFRGRLLGVMMILAGAPTILVWLIKLLA